LTVTDLVIVESPAKARTLGRYLDDGYRVEASVGHVRDLPKKGLGVDVEAGFEPEYVTIEGKGPVLRKLRAAAKRADRILLATDPDREGEAIAYHIAQALGAGKKEGAERFRRVSFNEITPRAVRAAMEQPGEIDADRVDAQQARRVLDRLVGYKLSPLLWKKIKPGLSAGRVQSVAVRLLVERERARRAFHSAVYWDLKAHLAADDGLSHSEQRVRDPVPFAAGLVEVDGQRTATGRDFDETTGKLKAGRKVLLVDKERVDSLKRRLADETFRVRSVTKKLFKTNPAPPFTTATLQQEGNRKLNLGSRDTMRVAQGLYERGLITYMRTDSVNLSGDAVSQIRSAVKARYGREYLSPRPRRYRTRSSTAQEAHEAIRPAGAKMNTAAELDLFGKERALYELVWRRAVATQMAASRQRRVTAVIGAAEAGFRARGKTIEFPGFLRAYVEGSDDPDALLENQEILLPDLVEGQELDLRKLESFERRTRPPARYTEAALVKALEQKGIGRPSTYAAIITTIQNRGYAELKKKNLHPTFIAFAVTLLMENHFPDLVDTGFTARMEESLDHIARGEIDWREYLKGFYKGEDGFEARLTTQQDTIDPRAASTVQLAGVTPRVRIGRYGPYLEDGGAANRRTAPLPEGMLPADLTAEEADEILRRREQGPAELGKDPKTGDSIYLMDGRFGPYVQRGESQQGKKPPRQGLPKGTAPEAVTLDLALRLLGLPRLVGEHPDTGEPVRAGSGRYGPYVVHKRDFRSLAPGDNLFTIGLERALELLSAPKRGARTRIREIGKHPDDGAPIEIFKGRYGPYVKHGKVNASIGKDADPADVDVPLAVELLNRRLKRDQARGRGKRKAKRVKRGSRSRR
jgi:DNA topoisomerase-1